MEVKSVDVIGVFNALKTKGVAKLSDFATPVSFDNEEEPEIDLSKFHAVEAEEMQTCVWPILFKCFDSKPIGTDNVKMGLFNGQVLAVKVVGNIARFALPFNGPMMLLVDYLTKENRKGVICKRHYNKTDSIMFRYEVNEDNTELTIHFYTKEFKLF